MSRFATSLLTAAAAGAGAYSLLRAEDERKKDFEAVDGALGGWVSWAVETVGGSKPTSAEEVQMDSPPEVRDEPVATVATVATSAASASSRPGYPYQLSIEPNPAGGSARWRVRISCTDQTAYDRPSLSEATVDSKANQEARVAKLMAG